MIPNLCFFQVVGNPFAITVFMILVIVRMEVPSEKRMELSQTISFTVRLHKDGEGMQALRLLSEYGG